MTATNIKEGYWFYLNVSNPKNNIVMCLRKLRLGKLWDFLKSKNSLSEFFFFNLVSTEREEASSATYPETCALGYNLFPFFPNIKMTLA